MSGIYIHIPFCKKACHYCNFHFSTNLTRKGELVSALCKDIELRHKYIGSDLLETIYFGGGTPSLLNNDELSQIFHTINQYFKTSKEAEITFECNPDDISQEYLTMLKEHGINRLSLGIQSFFDEDLKMMNRAHSGQEALQSIKLIKDAGFENISIDLIYGGPSTTNEMWQRNVEEVLKLDIPHISSYCLTIEEKTVYDNWVNTKKMEVPDDEKANSQFEYLINTLKSNGYEHYEISNFAKPGKYAVHNTNYWRGKKYLGVGPSAHSYDGNERSWAMANNALYVSNIEKGIDYVESEVLSDTDKYNEYIMISLRTMWGIDVRYVEKNFVTFKNHFENSLKDEWLIDKVIFDNGHYKLTDEGKFFADRIASMLFS